MRFKVGDKVQFLNEKGGGVITAILDNKLVKIKTEDGFEMPVLGNELIPDYRGQELKDEFRPKPSAITEDERQEESAEEALVSEINLFGKAKEEEGIYLVFEPHNQQWILTGDMDVLIVNHTSFEILYNLFLERGGSLKGIDYGSVPAESKILLDTISRDDLDAWIRGNLQVLLHEENPERIYFPVHSTIDIRPNRFFKEGSYLSNTLVNGKAVISVIALRSALQAAAGSEIQRKFEAKGVPTKSHTKIEKPFIDKFKTTFGEAVVDLHIGEVVNNIAGLSSRDMFNLQLNHFKKALDSAIEDGYQKVTFIHGVGNGALKNALIEELKHYEQLENSMASITKFGVGALDVAINDSNKK